MFGAGVGGHDRRLSVQMALGVVSVKQGMACAMMLSVTENWHWARLFRTLGCLGR